MPSIQCHGSNCRGGRASSLCLSTTPTSSTSLGESWATQQMLSTCAVPITLVLCALQYRTLLWVERERRCPRIAPRTTDLRASYQPIYNRPVPLLYLGDMTLVWSEVQSFLLPREACKSSLNAVQRMTFSRGFRWLAACDWIAVIHSSCDSGTRALIHAADPHKACARVYHTPSQVCRA